MTAFDDLPLHDAVLYRVSLDWEQRVASAEVAIFLDCSKPAVPAVLSWNGVRSLRLPCVEPWGPSVFINRQYKTGSSIYAIEIQSGDVLEIEADGFKLTRRDAVSSSGAESLTGANAELSLLVLPCKDLDQSRNFYEALGIAFTGEQHGSGPQHYSARLGETVLELYPAAELPSPGRIGIRVVDIAATVAAARSFADCVIRFDPERVPIFALLRDPDGNKVELTARTA